MAFYIDGKLLPEGVSFYDANGTQYPSNWLNQSNEEQAQVKDTANKLLANTDWYVIRKAERNVDIPTDIADKRSAIVTEANRLDSEIGLVDTVEGLIDILNNQNWGA